MGKVVVFVPSPILTVVIEDRGGSADVHVHAGGQGIWQARMASSIGADVVVCAALGGERGRLLRHLIGDEDLELRAIDGEFDNGTYVHDRRSGERVEIAEMAGDPLPRHTLDELYGKTVTEALDASVVVLSGPAGPDVLPADVYRRLAADLRSNGCQVVVDLAGERLSAALSGGLSVVKASHTELLDDGRSASDDQESLVEAMRDLQREGAESVVVSRAEEPALALIADTVFTVEMPALEPADHRGAGDSMTAGITAGIANGLTLIEAVRLGAAAGALNVTRHGLGTGDPEAIAALVERIELRPLVNANTAIPVTPRDLVNRLES